MAATDAKRSHPIVRILASFAVLGFTLYVVMREGRAPKATPPIATFRSRGAPAGGFAWIPHYPGAMINNIRTKETATELTYGFEMATSDAPADIVSYFERGLRGAGFTVETRNPSPTESNIHGESADHNRTIDVGVDKVQSGSMVIVSAAEK